MSRVAVPPVRYHTSGISIAESLEQTQAGGLE